MPHIVFPPCARAHAPDRRLAESRDGDLRGDAWLCPSRACVTRAPLRGHRRASPHRLEAVRLIDHGARPSGGSDRRRALPREIARGRILLPVLRLTLCLGAERARSGAEHWCDASGAEAPPPLVEGRLRIGPRAWCVVCASSRLCTPARRLTGKSSVEPCSAPKIARAAMASES